ncbi:MAG: GNAT family N-acetyltransferase [Synechococcales bacterium]|nr:GNAT family N-acetyltransferase [Synechococcales bacterium]
MTYTIRTLARDELHIAIGWAAAEGWNPGLHDADSFYAADSTGFWVGELNQQPIATLSAVKYGDTFGFLGFYIVHPHYRGQGYGIQLWQTVLQQLEGRNIGLDGVLAQQSNYQKSGFQLAYRNIRYAGITGGTPPNLSTIVNLAELPFDIIAQYDRPFFPADRTVFLQAWLQQPEKIALGMIQSDQLVGYGMIRACQSGYKIGPLFANTPAIAESLLLALTAHVPAQQPFYLDVPELNAAAVKLAETHQLQVVFETARMYNREFPDLPFDRLFGVTSFELG